MKVKTLAALAGLTGTLIASTQADAAYLSLTTVNVTSYFQNHPNSAVKANFLANGAGYQVWRVYAVFDGQGGVNDRVNAINGQVGHASDLSLSGGTIRNYTSYYNAQYDGAPANFNGGATGANAFRAWDTWMTINRDGLGGLANVAQFAPGSTDPGQWNHFTGAWSGVNNAAMYITPDDAQGAATSWTGQGGPASGVLLMQITVTNGAIFTGHFNLALGSNALTTSEVYDQVFTNVPAPGALALLGLAGVVGSRRRRA